MNEVNEFVVGQHYSNDQIRYSLRVENLGGIRPSLDETKCLRHVAIITHSGKSKSDLSENPYHDRIEDRILIYTAAGRVGDQDLVGRNKRIIEQYTNPAPFFGFINHGNQVYEFLGLLEVLRHYREWQVDKKKNLRKVWIFEFNMHQTPSIIPIKYAKKIFQEMALNSSLIGNCENKERDFAEKEIIFSKSQNSVELEWTRASLLMLNPYKFEYLIKDVLLKNGFENVEVTKSSGDGGIDLNAIADDSNIFFKGTLIQIQAKRWRHAVGSQEINSFRGAMSSTAKGIFITTSSYTRAAFENALDSTKTCVTLLNGYELSTIIIKSNISINNINRLQL